MIRLACRPDSDIQEKEPRWQSRCARCCCGIRAQDDRPGAGEEFLGNFPKFDINHNIKNLLKRHYNLKYLPTGNCKPDLALLLTGTLATSFALDFCQKCRNSTRFKSYCAHRNFPLAFAASTQPLPLDCRQVDWYLLLADCRVHGTSHVEFSIGSATAQICLLCPHR